MAVGCVECYYLMHGKYEPELKEYFHINRCQLNFEIFVQKSFLTRP